LSALPGGDQDSRDRACALIVLDPAAAHAGRLPARDDIGYFAAHPAHPPIFPEDLDEDRLC